MMDFLIKSCHFRLDLEAAYHCDEVPVLWLKHQKLQAIAISQFVPSLVQMVLEITVASLDTAVAATLVET